MKISNQKWRVRVTCSMYWDICVRTILFIKIGGYHLPEYDDCPIQFMRDILIGSKKVRILSLLSLYLGNKNGRCKTNCNSILW